MQMIVFSLLYMVLCFWLTVPFSGLASGDEGTDTINQKKESKGIHEPGEKRAPEADGDRRDVPDDPEMPIYRPPLRGAPAGRLAGGSRGNENEGPFICALAPNHVGRTVKEQPCLYWFLSKGTELPIEFTLIDVQGIEPLLEERVPRPKKPGIQSIPLKSYGIRLKKGVRYEWFVSLVPDPGHRSKDDIAGGMIERSESSASLEEELSGIGTARHPFIYAGNGLWYDALEAISDLIETNPDHPALRRIRSSLFEQVGLGRVAQYDMEAHD